MNIFIVSKHPIPELEHPDADLLVDDIIELFQDHDTCAVNSKQIALYKSKTSGAKFIYSLDIKKILG